MYSEMIDMDFYADSALLCCTVMNCIIFDIARRILRLKVKLRRLICFSAALSACGIVCLFFAAVRLAYIPVYAIAVYFLFGKCSFWELIRRFFICIGTSLLLSAVYLAVIPPDSFEILLTSGMSFYIADDFALYSSVIGVYAAVRIILFFMCEKRKRMRVRIKIGGRKTIGYAFADTGNSLRAPDGKPVILAEKSLFDENLTGAVKINCRTAANGLSEITAFPVEELYFEDIGRQWSGGAYAAKSDHMFSGGCSVLLHSSMNI